MRHWPSVSFEIETSMSLEDVISKLATQVDTEDVLSHGMGNKPFYGNFSREGFKIQRALISKNPCLPVIHGTFKQKSSDAKLKIIIKMELRPFTAVFMVTWIAMMAAINFVLLSKGQKEAIPPTVGILTVVHSAVPFGFWLETKKQRTMLVNLFQ